MAKCPWMMSWRPVLGATEPNNEQAPLLRDGMEVLVGVLGGVLSGLGEEKH
jgi:hypothetical protein